MRLLSHTMHVIFFQTKRFIRENEWLICRYSGQLPRPCPMRKSLLNAARVQQGLFHEIQATTCLPRDRSYLQRIVLIEHFSSVAKIQISLFVPLARVRDSTRGEFTHGAKRVLLVLSIRINKFPRDQFHCTKGMKSRR